MGQVAKVSLVSGQFWGASMPVLWARAWAYFAAALLFDLCGGFVRDNIQVLPPDTSNRAVITWGCRSLGGERASESARGRGGSERG